MLSALHEIDLQILQIATDFTSQSAFTQGCIYFLAEMLIFIFPAVLFYMWEKPEVASRHHGSRKAVMIALVSIVLAVALKSFINAVIARPRPFDSHPELFHLSFRVDPASFPSGHTLFSWAIASSFVMSGYRKLGVFLLVCAILVSLGRVFSGVHYPSDVLAGMIIGVGMAWYLHREASSLKRYLPNE